MWTLLLFGFIANQWCQVSVPNFSTKENCEQAFPVIAAQLSTNVFPDRFTGGVRYYYVCVESK